MKLIISANTQRSGSTLLQRICNANPRTMIWGEHGGIVTKFVEAYDTLSSYSGVSSRDRGIYFQQKDKRDPDQLISNLTPDLYYVKSAILSSLRSLLDNLYLQHKEFYDVVGFKEVRYGLRELEILFQAYRDAQFLLLIRNPIDVWKSMPPEWGWTIEVFTTQWSRIALDYYNVNGLKPNVTLFRYEDIVAQEQATLTRLSSIINVSLPDIKNVLSYRPGSTVHPITLDEEEIIKKRCGYAMERFGYYIG